jgi:predicted RNA-binding Zn-ribbon protein involved in translation (DUF1610 family)
MKEICPECDTEPVQRTESIVNIVYLCPDCGQQLGCSPAKE